LIIPSKCLYGIADRVKIILTLRIVCVGQAKSKLAHAEPIDIRLIRVVSNTGLGVIQANLGEFWSNPRLTTSKRGKARHI
jgi:hypothetical protein